MTIKRFEDLPVWQSAMDLGLRIYQLTTDSSFNQRGDLADQLRRAALSVSSNIAEGFERGTTPELLMFLYIARGSAGEVRSQLRFALQLPPLAHLQFPISDLIPLAESCSKQLYSWANSMQNSDSVGQRHLNDSVLEAFTAKRRADAFLKKLQTLTPHLNPNQTNPND